LNTINETYFEALLADAYYITLSQDNSVLPESHIISAIAARLAQPQADFINDNFEVLTQELSVIGGFDAVV
jgi:hypothetical protein